MALITTDEVRQFLESIRGQEITLRDLRSEFGIMSGDKSFDTIRYIIRDLQTQGVVKPVGKNAGRYKVIRRVHPIKIFGVERERRPPFPFKFPKDFDTGMEFPFAEKIVIREGDCILIGGVSNYGKTTISMNIIGENIDFNPALLGNEFSMADQPTERFLNRLDAMDWVQWTNSDGEDRFTLLPVNDDFAENIIKDRINVIDWINLPGEYYMISPLMEGLKRAIGKGIVIPILQKNEDSTHGRGGAPTRDFADLELLIDKHSEFESRLTIGKCKESKGFVVGRSWAYGIFNGVRITNMREVKKCRTCYGKGYTKHGGCEFCNESGWIDI